jgi:uncharacterized protein YcfJ
MEIVFGFVGGFVTALANGMGYFMKHVLGKSALTLVALAAVSAGALAQDVGRVVSSTPVITQVAVPRQVCAQEVQQVQTVTPASKTGAGALMGAIAGGAMGNAVGNGNGRAAATALGLFFGAVVGDKVEGGSQAQVSTTQQTVNRCSTQNFLENRTTAYNVVYEYAGKQYSVQMPQDPGPTIQLQVAPLTPAMPAQGGAPRVMSQAPVEQATEQAFVDQPANTISSAYQPFMTAPARIFTTEPTPTVVYVAQPTYYQRPYYPAYGASFVIRSGGHRHHPQQYPRYWR